MPVVDKQIPPKTLELLLKHKREVLADISSHYSGQLEDVSSDSERMLKYGFIFAAAVETAIGAFAAVQGSAGAALFSAMLLLLTLSISVVLFERIRNEKAQFHQQVLAERKPIMQQIDMLNGFLEPSDEQ